MKDRKRRETARVASQNHAYGYSREQYPSIHDGRAWLKKFPATRVIQWLNHAQERLSRCRRRQPDNQVPVSDPLFPKQKDSNGNGGGRLVALPPTLSSIRDRSPLHSFSSPGNRAIPERDQEKSGKVGRRRGMTEKGGEPRRHFGSWSALIYQVKCEVRRIMPAPRFSERIVMHARLLLLHTLL